MRNVVDRIIKKLEAERWYDYDSNGNMIHYKDSNNVEWNITITI